MANSRGGGKSGLLLFVAGVLVGLAAVFAGRVLSEPSHANGPSPGRVTDAALEEMADRVMRAHEARHREVQAEIAALRSAIQALTARVTDVPQHAEVVIDEASPTQGPVLRGVSEDAETEGPRLTYEEAREIRRRFYAENPKIARREARDLYGRVLNAYERVMPPLTERQREEIQSHLADHARQYLEPEDAERLYSGRMSKDDIRRAFADMDEALGRIRDHIEAYVLTDTQLLSLPDAR